MSTASAKYSMQCVWESSSNADENAWLGQESLSKLVKWLPLLRNCRRPMHSRPINSPARFSLLWLAEWQLCSHDCPRSLLEKRLKPPSCWLTGCTAGATLPLPLSAVTGCPCVRAQLYTLRWSSQPYTAILWVPSIPSRHGDLRHTPLTTHSDHVSVLLIH